MEMLIHIRLDDKWPVEILFMTISSYSATLVSFLGLILQHD